MNSRLYRVLFQWKCNGTHHKLAMEAVRLLPEVLPSDADTIECWQRLFLRDHDQYLTGSKAPDKVFKDFRNHVLHVGDEFWGGACVAAAEWYARLVDLLRAEDWEQAIYSAGVLSHYASDICMPLHTGQRDDESKMHRACEWSVSKSYDALRERIDPWPTIELGAGAGWLEEAIQTAATASYAHYDELVDGYALHLGVKRPTEGLTEPLKVFLADQLAHASGLITALLGKAIVESGAEPPSVSLSLRTVIETAKIPVHWITRKLTDAADRRFVRDIYKEYETTGTVEVNLPAEERCIREALREKNGEADADVTPSRNETQAEKTLTATSSEPAHDSVPGLPAMPSDPATLPLGKVPSKLKFYLEAAKPIEAAPSIGAKTARRLEAVGVHTVADLLNQDPEAAAAVLPVRYITAEVIREWQAQAALVCRVPGLRGHDAQFLTACGITDPEELSGCDAGTLFDLVVELLKTSEGERILRGGTPPDLEEVAGWIASAQAARQLDAA